MILIRSQGFKDSALFGAYQPHGKGLPTSNLETFLPEAHVLSTPSALGGCGCGEGWLQAGWVSGLLGGRLAGWVGEWVCIGLYRSLEKYRGCNYVCQ